MRIFCVLELVGKRLFQFGKFAESILAQDIFLVLIGDVGIVDSAPLKGAGITVRTEENFFRADALDGVFDDVVLIAERARGIREYVAMLGVLNDVDMIETAQMRIDEFHIGKLVGDRANFSGVIGVHQKRRAQIVGEGEQPPHLVHNFVVMEIGMNL